MEEPAGLQDEVDLKAAIRVLRRSGNGRAPDVLQIGVLLGELDSWLADERQWRRGEPTHWRSLIDDVLDRLRALRSLSSPPIQQALSDSFDEFTQGRNGFQKDAGPPDDALRRQLRRLSAVVRTEITKPELLVMAWKRIIDWTQSDPERAIAGTGVLRDLAELGGHDPDELFNRVDRVLADNAWVIAGLTGGPTPDHPKATAGETAETRLALTESVLIGPPRRAGGVVWLEYLQAELRFPFTLTLGPHVTLYQDEFLCGMLQQTPDDPRLPDDLRQLGENSFARSWFKAEEAERADQLGDVYLRLELPETSPTQLLADARETAEFLAAFGNLASDNHDLWLLSSSYLSPALGQSTSAMVVSAERAEEQRRNDMTALHLAQHADDLARHLPLRTDELRTAGRLMVWLRQTGATDSPARVVLCDRVIEQVCGWAGITQPRRFTEASLRPEWIQDRIRSDIVRSYRQLRFSPLGDHELWNVIEPSAPEPPHAPRFWIGPTNLKAILENIDELATLGEGLDQGVAIRRLRERVTDRDSVRAWLDELGEGFDRRNRRLRRTRNALMHGGPITTDTVNHVSEFSMQLAYLAIGPAVNLLLKDRDLVDGFLDNRDQLTRCYARLREGVPVSDALFLRET